VGAALCLSVIAAAGWALSQSIEQWSYWRAKLWAADFQIWRDFPVFGIGVGNHPYVYRAYLDEYVAVTFSTGESSWLQFLVETGLVGTLLAAFIVSAIFYNILRNLSLQMHLSHAMMLCASLAGLIASCTHATVDFPWHIPACFITVLALVAVAIRLPHFLSHAPKTNRPTLFDSIPSMSVAIAGLLLMGNLWAITSAIPSARAARPWDDYRRMVRDQPEDRDDGNSKDEVALLTQTLQLDPYHVLARVKLTHYLAAELDRRRAQMQSSPELANAVLKQATVIATICPTESRSYLYASSALAAYDAPLSKQQALLSQSQRLRLVDGRVALRLGVNALLAQDQALVDRQFNIALNQDPSYVEHVVGILSVLYPFEEILNRWYPNRNSSAVIFNQARQKGTADQLKKVGQYYCLRLAEDAERESSSSNRDHLLESALIVAKQVDDKELQLKMANLRIENQPQNVSLILERAVLFIMQDDHESAKRDLQLARDISPHDARIRQVAYQMDKANRPSLR
jgi:heme/copper-type cytochrome/quinol oxidase subunit 4